MSTPTVLIVEDDPRMRDMLSRAVAEAGFQATSARSGEQALKLCDTTVAPDVVLLDLNLPGIDGLELLGLLRERMREIPAVILTGFGSLDAAKRAIRCDVTDFLTKPCRLEDLEIALARARQRLIAKRRAPAEPVKEPAADTGGQRTLEQLEQEHILAALQRHEGNRAATAAELGISERTLYYRLAQYQKQGLL